VAKKKGKESEDEEQVYYMQQRTSDLEVGVFCVGVSDASSGPSPYVWVGKVTAVSDDKQTFSRHICDCLTAGWKKECLTAPWHMRTNGNIAARTQHGCLHSSVMMYFKKWGKDKKYLPRLGHLQSFRTEWCDPAAVGATEEREGDDDSEGSVYAPDDSE
jgi:hypothetical protein